MKLVCPGRTKFGFRARALLGLDRRAACPTWFCERYNQQLRKHAHRAWLPLLADWGREACATPSRLPAGGTPNMATLREQIATNVLTMTKFRDLLHRMRENRPNDDL